MKRLSIFLYVLLLTVFSCEKDETRVVLKSDATPPEISAPSADSELVITEPKLGDEIEFTWTDTDYGVNTEVTYTLELDSKCNSFADPLMIGSTTSTSLPMTMEALNSKLVNEFKLAPHQLSELQLRVTSVINNKYKSISQAVPVNIMPWSDKPLALWMGENSTTAPVLFATGESTYEGYRYLAEGTSFRLSTNPVCANVIYGASGVVGELAEGVTSSEIEITTSGYYKINANTENHSYSMTLITTWGMIGTATPGGWGASTPLTYNSTKDVWESELTLTAGALKFRANNGWDINYGTGNIDALAGSLSFDAAAINIAEPGNYIVSVDFSQKNAPYAFTYSVTKSSNVPEPSKLWLPGSYQGWSPSTAPTIYAVSDVAYEGYVFIPVGAGFKFTSAPDWDHINYGDSGTPNLLTTDGSKDGLSLPNPGYYKFYVNTSTLAYNIDLITTWGLIGTATSGGWDNSTAMTYDQANDVWKVTADLAAGALKFRANNGWGINYGVGDTNALEGNLVWDAASINIGEAGNYTVTLDFSRSEAPYRYTYSVKKN
jgi:starch-binding outer membrane protein SusE/F